MIMSPAVLFNNDYTVQEIHSGCHASPSCGHHTHNALTCSFTPRGNLVPLKHLTATDYTLDIEHKNCSMQIGYYQLPLDINAWLHVCAMQCSSPWMNKCYDQKKAITKMNLAMMWYIIKSFVEQNREDWLGWCAKLWIKSLIIIIIIFDSRQYLQNYVWGGMVRLWATIDWLLKMNECICHVSSYHSGSKSS